MELKKTEEQMLAQVDPLMATSQELLARANKLEITNDEELKSATALKKEITAQAKTVNELRFEITRPLDELKDRILSKEKEILVPLSEARNDIASKILAYEEELERIRKEEEDRIIGITTELMRYMPFPALTDVKKIEERIKEFDQEFGKLAEADQNNPRIKAVYIDVSSQLVFHQAKVVEEAKTAAERARLDEEAKTQSEERRKIEAEKQQIEEDKRKIEREKQELAAQQEADRLRKIADAKAEEEAKALAKRPKTAIRTDTKFEVTDIEAVPRELCSPDDKKIRQAVANGAKEIPGVRIYQEKAVR
jgi:hypothetical protein